jgi:hypothetical protein
LFTSTIVILSKTPFVSRRIWARRAIILAFFATMQSRASGALSLPGRLRNPWNLPAQRELAEAQAADAELAQKSPRASAQLAAVMLARGELGLLYVFRLLMQPDAVFHSLCCSQP